MILALMIAVMLLLLLLMALVMLAMLAILAMRAMLVGCSPRLMTIVPALPPLAVIVLALPALMTVMFVAKKLLNLQWTMLFLKVASTKKTAVCITRYCRQRPLFLKQSKLKTTVKVPQKTRAF